LILVVDDDPDIRTFVHMILEEEGYAVQGAGDGREALARVQQQRPSLILLDLNMPVMSGWELHEELRTHQVGVPVVYMSAAQRACGEAEQHGAQGYLAKPFGLGELLNTVERFVA
jgi:CheY-like chemotaxis protein